MPFVPLCDSSTNSTDHEACAVSNPESGASYSLQMFLTLFLIIGMLVLLILFVSRIRSILSSPKPLTNPPAQSSSQSEQHHSLFYLSNGHLHSTPTLEMLSRIRSDLLSAAIAQQSNPLSRVQLSSFGSNQLFLLSHTGPNELTPEQQISFAEMLRLELPPPSYTDILKTGPTKPNDHSELPPPSYNQLTALPQPITTL